MRPSNGSGKPQLLHAHTLFVFSYGSNMCRARLLERTPSARCFGTGRLVGHALRFHKIGRDESGKADAFRTGRHTDSVWGVLCEIDRRDLPALDAAESLGRGYDVLHAEIACARRVVNARLYVAGRDWIDPARPPFDWYRDLAVAGALEHGLPATYVAALRNVPAVPDPDAERERRHRRLLDSANLGGRATG